MRSLRICILAQYFSGSRIEKNEKGGICSACGGGERRIYSFGGKPKGRKPLGKRRRRWVENIKMDLREVVCGSMDWIELTQDRDRCRALVNAVMNLRVP